MNRAFCEDVCNVLNNQFNHIERTFFTCVHPNLHEMGMSPRKVTIQEISNLQPIVKYGNNNELYCVSMGDVFVYIHINALSEVYYIRLHDAPTEDTISKIMHGEYEY